MTAEDTALLPALIAYVGRCPDCGKSIREPFSRFSGPVAFIHGRRCRLVVVPAQRGEQHQVIRVPRDQTLEQALLEQIRKACPPMNARAPAA